MPYRVDIPGGADAAFERLVDLGALDVEASPRGGVAAVLPDSVAPESLADVLGIDRIRVSRAIGRDADSVWILSPRPLHVGSLRIVPAHLEPEPGALRLLDTAAFGTGLHPTTALCLEALEEAVRNGPPDAVLDVGTGSGVLALAALVLGVPRALAIDVDEAALRAAAGNARLNGLAERVEFALATPDTAPGSWPLVLANVLAAPLIAMAPAVSQRVGHQGRLVLSGVRASLEAEVARAYRRVGMRCVEVKARDGWAALVLQASW